MTFNQVCWNIKTEDFLYRTCENLYDKTSFIVRYYVSNCSHIIKFSWHISGGFRWQFWKYRGYGYCPLWLPSCCRWWNFIWPKWYNNKHWNGKRTCNCLSYLSWDALMLIGIIFMFCIVGTNHFLFQVDDGWWLGECHGKFGLFPANYVEIKQW